MGRHGVVLLLAGVMGQCHGYVRRGARARADGCPAPCNQSPPSAIRIRRPNPRLDLAELGGVGVRLPRGDHDPVLLRRQLA